MHEWLFNIIKIRGCFVEASKFIYAIHIFVMKSCDKKREWSKLNTHESKVEGK